MPDINNPHDKFFKEVFSGKEEIASLMRGVLPENIKNRIDFQSLTADTNNYTDERLNEYFTDIVYTCQTQKHEKLKIAFLFEHKSYVPDYPHLQISRYILNIQDKHLEEENLIIPVIPIILYHGIKEWKKRPCKAYYPKDYQEDIMSYQIEMDYVLLHLNRYSENEIKQLFDSLKVQMALMVMRNIFDDLRLQQQVRFIFAEIGHLISTEQGNMFFDTIFLYMLNSSNIDDKQVIIDITDINQTGGQKAMTTAEKLKKQGFERGIEQGIEQGIERGIERGQKRKSVISALKMLKADLSVADIIDFTDLSETEMSLITAYYNKFGMQAIDHIEISENGIDAK